MSKKSGVSHPQNVTVYEEDEPAIGNTIKYKIHSTMPSYSNMYKILAEDNNGEMVDITEEVERKEKAVTDAIENLKSQKRIKEVESKGHNNRAHRGKAIKNDGLKPRMSLIPQLAKIEVARVMTYGANKYAAYNWMEGFDFGKLSDALERHLTAFNCGEDIDPESGFHHLAHASCCAMMLLENVLLYPDLDDRWEGWQEEKGKKARGKEMETKKEGPSGEE